MWQCCLFPRLAAKGQTPRPGGAAGGYAPLVPLPLPDEEGDGVRENRLQNPGRGYPV